MVCLRSLCATTLLCFVGCMPPSSSGGSSRDNGDGDGRGGADRGRSGGSRDGGSLEGSNPTPINNGRTDASQELAPDFGTVDPVPTADAASPVPPDARPRLDAGALPPCDDRLPPGEVQLGVLEPASVIESLEIVPSFRAAAAAGCEVEGENQGTGLAGLQGLLGPTAPNLRIPRGSDLVDFIHITSWGPETSLSAGAPVVSWHQGIQRGGTVESERREAVLGALDLDCPTLRARFSQPFAIFSTDEANPFTFILDYADLKMDVLPHAAGFDSTGTIAGYVTIERMTEMVEDLQEACSSDERPAYCAQLQQIFSGTPQAVVSELLLPIVNGADVRIDQDGEASGQCGADCNAVSVCLSFIGEAALRGFPQ